MRQHLNLLQYANEYAQRSISIYTYIVQQQQQAAAHIVQVHTPHTHIVYKSSLYIYEFLHEFYIVCARVCVCAF